MCGVSLVDWNKAPKPANTGTDTHWSPKKQLKIKSFILWSWPMQRKHKFWYCCEWVFLHSLFGFPIVFNSAYVSYFFCGWFGWLACPFDFGSESTQNHLQLLHMHTVHTQAKQWEKRCVVSRANALSKQWQHKISMFILVYFVLHCLAGKNETKREEEEGDERHQQK